MILRRLAAALVATGMALGVVVATSMDTSAAPTPDAGAAPVVTPGAPRGIDAGLPPLPPRPGEAPPPSVRPVTAPPAPSPLVYPGASPRVGPPQFQHAPHAALPCAGCHLGLERTRRPGDAPPTKACQDCHAAQPAHEAAPRDLARPATPQATPARLHFSHQAHLARGAACSECHAPATPDGEPNATPLMAECLHCHDGRQASAQCATCHPAGPDGRLRLDLPGGRLMPADHGDPAADFARQHGLAARANPASCDACHAERTCQKCHTDRRRPIDLHPADYILTHPPDARRNSPDCSSCHRLQTFCVGCHTQAGAVDQPGPAGWTAGQSAPTAFHAPGWTAPIGALPGPGHHRHAARRNLRECVSCHTEESCVVCHGTQASDAVRASPHPPGFRRHCGRALDSNERGCLKCHGDRAALEAMCAR